MRNDNIPAEMKDGETEAEYADRRFFRISIRGDEGGTRGRVCIRNEGKTMAGGRREVSRRKETDGG